MATITLARELPYPIEEVWAALTTPDTISHWYWAAQDMPLAVDVDVRPGGKLSIQMGSESTTTGTYTDVEPPTLLAWDEDQLDPIDSRHDEKSHIRIDLINNQGATSVTVTQDGLPDDEVQGREQNWIGSLDRIMGHLSNHSK